MESADLVVVGAGPAGLCAAIEGAKAGLDVVVVDENNRPGGQIFRQLPESFSSRNHRGASQDDRRGRALLQEVDQLPIRVLNDTLVWGVFEQRVLELCDSHRCFRLKARALVIAPGAYDRPVPLPGWTLPGVLTVGGAQTLLKSQRILPGKKILLAGTGPLQLVVASQLVNAGARVVAVAEAVHLRSLLPFAWALGRAWSITRNGVLYRWHVLRSRVPWMAPYVLTRIQGEQEVEGAVIAKADSAWRPISGTEVAIEVDTVCIGYGLIPSIELLRLCGCAVRYDSPTDVWVPERNDEFETSIPGVFAVGDGAGVAGAVVASEEGRIAGLAVARRLRGRLPNDSLDRLRRARRSLAKLECFLHAMDTVYHIRPGLHELATPDTFVCRCEEIRLRDLDEAIAGGAHSLNQLKAWTRAGMGMCQARMCALPTAHFLSRRVGVAIADLGCYSPRHPVKPVPIGALIASEE